MDGRWKFQLNLAESPEFLVGQLVDGPPERSKGRLGGSGLFVVLKCATPVTESIRSRGRVIGKVEIPSLWIWDKRNGRDV